MEKKEWKWIRDCIDEKKSEEFKRYVDGFSDFLTVINKDYLYNKKFLSTYVDDFIKYNGIFSRKYKILEKILGILNEYKDILKDVVVSVDGLVGMYDGEHESIDINRKEFDFSRIRNNETIVEILYENGRNVYQFKIDNKKMSIEGEIEKFIEVIKGGENE